MRRGGCVRAKVSGAWRTLALGIALSATLSACAKEEVERRPAYPATVPTTADTPRTSCVSFVVTEIELAACKARAEAHGDAAAARKVADYYGQRLGKARDPALAILSYNKAADLGDLGALRVLFDTYARGSEVPKNSIAPTSRRTRGAAVGQ